MKEKLRLLAETLSECGEQDHAARVNLAASSTCEELSAFLVSNDLWGGAGSIADQAGLRGERSENRRKIKRALIQLGNEQIREKCVNVRTASWVQAFEEWVKSGI